MFRCCLFILPAANAGGWVESTEEARNMKIHQCGWLSLSLVVAVGLSACGGGEGDPVDLQNCIDPDDPRASDPALRDEFRICPDIGGSVGSTPPREPEDADCPAADVSAWQVSIRYSGELGGTSGDGRRVVEHQVTAELSARLDMQRRNSASGENWSPSGRVTQQMREYADGERILTAVGEGAPVPGNSSTITDSRILLSIDPSACTYNLYSSGTVMSQVTRDDSTTTAPVGYGTVIIRQQPASVSISESRNLPVVEESFDPRDERPMLYIPGVGTQEGDGVLVSWRLEPVGP